jgi:allophanate hydrolase
MTRQINRSVSGLLEHYRTGDFSPREYLSRQLELIQRFKINPAWIACQTHEQLEPYLQRLEESSPGHLPLYGVPYAIKDNIELAG